MSVEELGPHLREEWQRIKEALLAERYEPQPVQRVEIPKPGGGMRQLGIPTVVDRLIQQALHQVMSRVFEPGFSESSYGFRPGRSAHDAVLKARRVRGRRQAVGGRHGPGEVLRPGEPRRADGAGGAHGEGQAGAEAGEAIPGGRCHGRRAGVTDDGGNAARRPDSPTNNVAYGGLDIVGVVSRTVLRPSYGQGFLGSSPSESSVPGRGVVFDAAPGVVINAEGGR